MDTSTSQFSTTLAQANQAVASFWQIPAAYWQTVGSIMGARSQTATAMATTLHETAQKTMSSQSLPECVGLWASCWGQNIQQLTQLNMHTHQNRMALMQQCQHLITRSWMDASTAITTPTQHTSPTPASASQPRAMSHSPSPTFMRGTFIPAATKTPATVQPSIPLQTGFAKAHIPAQKELASPVIPSQTKLAAPAIPQQQRIMPAIPQQTSFATPRQTEQMVTASMGNAALSPVVSTTANSVVRSATGHTVAASAAARRSVVARRNTRRTRLARGTR